MPLLLVAAPIAVRTFIALVPPGTLRLAPGMPAAVMVRGILTFAFFGADAYVSLTFQDVRDQPTWVAGVALTGATLGWTTAAWIQQRWIHTAGPRRVVATGFTFLAVGIAGMFGALGDAPDPAVHRRVDDGRLRHRHGLLAAVGHRPRPRRARHARASPAAASSSPTSSASRSAPASAAPSSPSASPRAGRRSAALAFAFPITCGAAVAGIFAARRLPTTLPG